MGGRPVGHPGCEEGAQESLRGVTRPEEGHVGLSAAGADAAGGWSLRKVRGRLGVCGPWLRSAFLLFLAHTPVQGL